MQELAARHARCSDQRCVGKPDAVSNGYRPRGQSSDQHCEFGIRRIHGVTVGIARLDSGRPHDVCKRLHSEGAEQHRRHADSSTSGKAARKVINGSPNVGD
jgi:hypothetical protein